MRKEEDKMEEDGMMPDEEEVKEEIPVASDFK
jgi:hypothetical protein